MRLFYTALLIALSSAALAQSNYHEGYVVKSNGDTLKGYINYREWNLSPIAIDFKVNKEDKQVLHFEPKDIKRFEIRNLESYKSYTGLISTDRNRFPDLPDNLDTTKIQSALFMKEVVAGNNLSLYSNADIKKTRYFVTDADGNVEELKYYQYYGDQHETVERAFFRGQLIFYINKYLPGNTGLAARAGTTLFEEGQLVEIVSKINTNQNYMGGKHGKSSARFFAGASILYNQPSYTNNNFQQLGDFGSHYYIISNRSTNITPQFDFGVDLFINPNVQRFFFRAEVDLSEISPRLTYPVPGILDSQPVDILTFNQYTISFHPQFLYNFYNKDNFKIYINAGVSLNLSEYQNTKFTSTTTGQIDAGQQGFAFNNFWVGIPLGVGISVNKRIDIGVNYIPDTRFSPGNTSYVSNRAGSIGVKYLFGSR